jgi:hypothetical protein
MVQNRSSITTSHFLYNDHFNSRRIWYFTQLIYWIRVLRIQLVFGHLLFETCLLTDIHTVKVDFKNEFELWTLISVLKWYLNTVGSEYRTSKSRIHLKSGQICVPFWNGYCRLIYAESTHFYYSKTGPDHFHLNSLDHFK